METPNNEMLYVQHRWDRKRTVIVLIESSDIELEWWVDK